MRLSKIVGEGYGDFWNDKSRYRVLKGGKASKKSTTTALNCIYRLMRYPESNLLVVRKVADTHRNSTFAQLKWAQNQLGVAHLWENTVSPLMMRYKLNGATIIFRGFDDVDKLASTTVETGYLCWTWLEEAFEINLESDFNKLDLSVPRGQMPDHLWKQTTITFNPWSEKHWLKSRFFDAPDSNTFTKTTTYKDNEFLDDIDLQVFSRMKENNPRLYDVAGLGNWGIAEGLVFENWRVEDFDKDKIGGEDKWKYRFQFGLDYGFTNDPTAFIAVAANPMDKVAYIYDEHSEKGMLTSDIAKMIEDKGYRKEIIVADCADPRTTAELARLGVTRITPSVKGTDSIRSSIAKVQEYKIIVHPTCKNTIAELSSYSWDKDRYGNPIDRPIDTNNHLMDALRYSFKDIEYFHPSNKRISVPQGLITAEDMRGGWE